MNFEEYWDKECSDKIFYVPWDEEPIARKAWEAATESERNRILEVIKKHTGYGWDNWSQAARAILDDIDDIKIGG